MTRLNLLNYKFNFVNNIILIAILFFISQDVFSDDTISAGLFPSEAQLQLYEIGEISFNGNENFTSDELMAAISSRPSIRSIQHNFFERLSIEINKNPVSPKLLKRSLEKTVKSYSHELRFFNEVRARNDAESILRLYNNNGFHEANVSYSFIPDSARKINLLTFNIIEKSRYKLANIEYIGLDNLPDEIQSEISNARIIKFDAPFSEKALVSEISKILFILQDNGYFYTSFNKKPVVKSDTANKTDSVYIYINPGNRQRISGIIISDSTNGQPTVSSKAKEEQLEFSVGDWYSVSKIKRTEDNLRYLGTFEYVSIDTSSLITPHTDTSLSFRILLQYKLLREYGFSPYINQTSYDKVLNGGFELYYVNRNLLGKAQVFNPYARFNLRDLSRTVSNIEEWEPEGQIGFKYGQSLLWSIGSSKVGLFLNPAWSYRNVYNLFPIHTISLPIKFPVRQPGHTYIGSMIFDITFLWEKPVNFADAKNKGLSSAKNSEDSLSVLESILLYENLDNYVNTSGFKPLTASIFSISMIGDHRNDFFSPTNGDYFSFSVDGSPIISGIAKYIRAQAVYYLFHSFNRYTILATKIRAGHIIQFDKSKSYVPNDRQFFAGGANSIRGWPSRKLRYSTFEGDSTLSGTYYSFLQDFVGNATIIEMSAEIRYTFQRSAKLGETISNILNQLGFILFLDIGNSFNWFTGLDAIKPQPLDYITKLAVAAGFGFRYNTPVGPFRVDFGWKFYDPSKQINQFIWQTPFYISDVQLHIGIGHAF